VSFCSLEMTEAELQMRMIAQYGPVALGALRNRKLTDEDKKRVAEARTKMQAAPLYVDDTAGMTLGEIRSHARAVARKGALAGVVVDYLQLVHGEGETRERAVAGVVGGLKQLAKDLNVPVIAAAQLKRAGMRKMDLPTMEDLRESGSIEQDADCVILLHRDPKVPDVLKMIVAKNRHGESGEFTVRWQGQYARLMDLSYGQTPLFD
jgi:replicative DNA helicase